MRYLVGAGILSACVLIASSAGAQTRPTAAPDKVIALDGPAWANPYRTRFAHQRPRRYVRRTRSRAAFYELPRRYPGQHELPPIFTGRVSASEPTSLGSPTALLGSGPPGGASDRLHPDAHQRGERRSQNSPASFQIRQRLPTLLKARQRKTTSCPHRCWTTAPLQDRQHVLQAHFVRIETVKIGRTVTG